MLALLLKGALLCEHHLRGKFYQIFDVTEPAQVVHIVVLSHFTFEA
jgi:hypothetical protein